MAQQKTTKAAIARVDGELEIEEMPALKTLSERDRGICQLMIIKGSRAVFADLKWTRAEQQAFTNRRDVSTYLDLLLEQFDEREAINERGRFFAKMKLSLSAPRAAQVLIDALNPKTDDDGTVDNPVTAEQIDVATRILQFVNVKDDPHEVERPNVSAAVQVNNVVDATDPQGRAKLLDFVHDTIKTASKAKPKQDTPRKPKIRRKVREGEARRSKKK